MSLYFIAAMARARPGFDSTWGGVTSLCHPAPSTPVLPHLQRPELLHIAAILNVRDGEQATEDGSHHSSPQMCRPTKISLWLWLQVVAYIYEMKLRPNINS